MTDNDTTTVHKGTFRYVTKDAKLAVNPDLYHLPPLSAFSDVRLLPITDIRPSLALGNDSPYRLSHHGFTARYHPSRLHTSPYSKSSWNDPNLIQSIYVPEVEDLVKQLTGCTTALVESAIIRNTIHTEVDSLSQSEDRPKLDSESPTDVDDDDDAGPCPRMIGFSQAGGASPAPKVHLDFSPIGSRTHIRKYHCDLTLAAKQVIEAENRLLISGVTWGQLREHQREPDEQEGTIPRFALFSIWRPLKTVRRDPLALSSCATYPTSDYVPVDIVQPSGRCVPIHLSQIIKPEINRSHSDTRSDASESESEGLAPHTHLSGSYLSLGPGEKGHNWHFISDQEPEDVLIIQLFDSRMEAKGVEVEYDGEGETGIAEPERVGKIPVSGVMHSSFELEGQNYSGEARESLEVRVAAFW